MITMIVFVINRSEYILTPSICNENNIIGSNSCFKRTEMYDDTDNSPIVKILNPIIRSRYVVSLNTGL